MTDETTHRRMSDLVRIGEAGIAGGDSAAIDAYYSTAFVLHGPGGDRGLADTKAFFEVMRTAFPDLEVRRSQMIGSEDLLAARSIMKGTFSGPFPSAYGELPPTGRPMRLEIVGVMRFDADGLLAEEWLQYDELGFLGQLGLELVPNH